MTFTGDAS